MAKEAGIDSKLSSATDPPLGHVLRESKGKQSHLRLSEQQHKLRKQRTCPATQNVALYFQLKVIGDSGMSDFSFYSEYTVLQTGGQNPLWCSLGKGNFLLCGGSDHVDGEKVWSTDSQSVFSLFPVFSCTYPPHSSQCCVCVLASIFFAHGFI